MNCGLQKVNVVVDDLISRYPSLTFCVEQIWNSYDMLVEAYNSGHCLYVAGNGGSAADSEHIVGELMKSFRRKRTVDIETLHNFAQLFPEDETGLLARLEGGLPAISLPSLTGLNSAVANDVDGDMIFAQALYSVSRAADVFLGISTSGNSKNIINALMVAKASRVRTIGLTGKAACRMDDLCDVVIHVPETETYKIQELHLPIYHAICAMLEEKFWG